jgi:hypothetical protein
MATSYTTLLGLALPATGELSGTWGDTVNNYISNYVDVAIAGTQTISADTTLTKTTGASLGSTSSQYAVILCSGLAANITITAPAASKAYFVINASTTYNVTLKATGQTGFIIYPGTNVVAAYNGTDFVPIGGYLGIPQNSQSTAYTTVLGDAGKHIFHPSSDANARTFTIAANASVAYPVGTVIAFVNMSSSNVTIAINSDTLTWAQGGSSGSRTLAQYGVANCLKIASTQWLLTGTNVT